MFYLYREPNRNEQVVIGADPADGGSNYCAAVAKSKKQADSFLVFYHRMDSAQFGHELFKMAKFVQKRTGLWPVIGVERNTGMATISTLQLLNYPQMFRMPEVGVSHPRDEGDTRKIGWITNAATRPKMLDDFSLSLKQRVNRIYDEETVKEMFSFVRSGATGRPEAASGALDDLVMAEAIAWQLYNLAQLLPVGVLMENAAILRQFPQQNIFDDNGVPNV